jgi:DNA mismatch repair protein MutH
MIAITPPKSEAELLQRCHQISGRTFFELAMAYHQTVPTSLNQAKGFMGQLIEQILGASAGNQPEPDFPNLGIELKTLPINADGRPRESTYVCTAPLGLNAQIEQWENSRVRKKLARVLWLPIIADPNIDLSERRIGSALLWSPNAHTLTTLQQDWEELTQMLHLGQVANLSAKIGTYLQIRPKAAHSRILYPSVNEHGEEILMNPKGFYLRTSLTQKILQEHYCYS